MIRSTSIHHNKKWTSQGPQLHTDIGLQVVVSESSPNDSDSTIEANISEAINQRYAAVLKKLKALNSDILGVGLLFRPQMTQKQIEDWAEKWYPRLEQSINVSINVQNNIYLKENMLNENSPN